MYTVMTLPIFFFLLYIKNIPQCYQEKTILTKYRNITDIFIITIKKDGGDNGTHYPVPNPSPV